NSGWLASRLLLEGIRAEARVLRCSGQALESALEADRGHVAGTTWTLPSGLPGHSRPTLPANRDVSYRDGAKVNMEHVPPGLLIRKLKLAPGPIHPLRFPQ
ncbi:hypothetical protein EIP91_005002, partial [Steccherinum ochraceum]